MHPALQYSDRPEENNQVWTLRGGTMHAGWRAIKSNGVRAPSYSWGALKDGNGSDTHEIEFGCRFVSYFNSDTNTDTNIFEYESKTDTSDLDSHLDIYSIQSETNIAKFN